MWYTPKKGSVYKRADLRLEQIHKLITKLRKRFSTSLIACKRSADAYTVPAVNWFKHKKIASIKFYVTLCKLYANNLKKIFLKTKQLVINKNWMFSWFLMLLKSWCLLELDISLIVLQLKLYCWTEQVEMI